MKNIHLVLFAVILAGLVALYVAQQRSSRITVVETGIYPVLADLDKESIAEIRAYTTKEEPKLIIQRTEGAWSIPSYFDARVDENKIQTLLRNLEDLKGEKRTSGEDLLAKFDLKEDQALSLELLDEKGQPLLTLLVGKQGPDGAGCFVRKKGEPDVYLAEVNLAAVFGIHGGDGRSLDPKLWADLKVVRSSKDEWSRVEVIQPGMTVLFEKQEQNIQKEGSGKPSETEQQKEETSVWVQKEPDKPEMEKSQMETVLIGLERLQGTEIIDPTLLDSYGLNDALYQANITVKEGAMIRVLINRPQENGPVYAKLEENSQVFEIAETSFNSIFDVIKKELSEKPQESE